MARVEAWVVDDLAQTRSWLRAALEQALDDPLIRDAGTLAGARRLHAEHGWPTLALIDLHLPDGSGVELIRELHRAQPRARILVPTIFDDDAHLFGAIRAGAGGHLLKDQPVEVLARTLRAQLDGAPSVLSPSLARRILQQLDAAGAPPDEAVRRYLQQRARGIAAAQAADLAGINDAMLRDALAPLR
jgi:DNA-binding NarL/FixJ family response regulator